MSDPSTPLWRTLPAGPEGPKRSELARIYREQLGEDWRDYYDGWPYEDDGPNEWEDEDES